MGVEGEGIVKTFKCDHYKVFISTGIVFLVLKLNNIH
jgi:hypothetical protein